IFPPDPMTITVEAKNVNDPFFVAVNFTATLDPLDSQTLLIDLINGFEHNKIYKLTLNQIESLAGNFSALFETYFTVYQPGDTLMRGRIGVADLYKYAKVIFNSNYVLVSPIPEIAELNGSDSFDTQDLLLLQSIILEEKTFQDIVLGSSIQITN